MAMHADQGPRPGRAAIGDACEQLAGCGRDLFGKGLLTQTAGNLSIRVGDEICITPTSMEYNRVEPSDIALAGLDGKLHRALHRPSSELPLHCMVYQSRPDISAIVHTHSPSATTLAILHLPIPAVHYMIAVTRSTEIPVARYATYGTEDLARSVRDAFPAPARAVLIANHGLVAVGETLSTAAAVAEAVETLAGLYCRALAIGKPNVLSDEQMADVLAKYEAKPGTRP
jgi:L-fuculose-phosphate aldolase